MGSMVRIILHDSLFGVAVIVIMSKDVCGQVLLLNPAAKQEND